MLIVFPNNETEVVTRARRYIFILITVHPHSSHFFIRPRWCSIRKRCDRLIPKSGSTEVGKWTCMDSPYHFLSIMVLCDCPFGFGSWESCLHKLKPTFFSHTHLLNYSPTRSLNHSLDHSITHSIIQSLTRSSREAHPLAGNSILPWNLPEGSIFILRYSVWLSLTPILFVCFVWVLN
ncbi:MAG: hypothetical protein BYD32DRAFT_74993 [Podila humilis]|nr:MAG: hypothetical protein BYD32DRAFT_74993 [Podila humilis]